MEVREEMDQLLISGSSSTSAEARPWDGTASESSWEELDTCESGVRVQARRVQMRPGGLHVGRGFSHEEFEDSDGEGFEFVPCYLAQH